MPEEINLEEPAAAAGGPPSPVSTNPEPDDKELEHDAIEVPAPAGKQRVVPLDVAIKERKQARDLKARVTELEAKAKELDGLNAQLAPLAPVLTKLLQQPELIPQIVNGTVQTKDTKPQPEDDAEAREMAETVGLYTATGELDIARGRKVLDKVERLAGKRAEAIVEPVRATGIAQQATAVRTWCQTVKFKDGRQPASQESIREVLSRTPDADLVKPGMAEMVLTLAAGIDTQHGRAANPRSSEPVFVENSGGRSPGSRNMSEMERAAARARGISDDKWAKLSDTDNLVLE